MTAQQKTNAHLAHMGFQTIQGIESRPLPIVGKLISHLDTISCGRAPTKALKAWLVAVTVDVPCGLRLPVATGLRTVFDPCSRRLFPHEFFFASSCWAWRRPANRSIHHTVAFRGGGKRFRLKFFNQFRHHHSATDYECESLTSDN